jgi:hypothetical protein
VAFDDIHQPPAAFAAADHGNFHIRVSFRSVPARFRAYAAIIGKNPFKVNDRP